MGLPAVSAVFGLLFLGACAVSPQPGETLPPAENPPPDNARSATAAAAAAPKSHPAFSDAAPTTALTAPGPAEPPIPEAVPEPVALTGMDRDDVTALLGAPAFQRTDRPAALWRYDDRHCLLDVYFYPRDGELRVVHYETRPRGGKRIPADCFDRRILFEPAAHATTAKGVQ